jgi:hypothetical protein
MNGNSNDFICGFGLAVAEMLRYMASEAAAVQAMRSAGLTVADLKRAGLEAFDTDEIAKCFPKEPKRKPKPKYKYYVTLYDTESRKRIAVGPFPSMVAAMKWRHTLPVQPDRQPVCTPYLPKGTRPRRPVAFSS